MKYASVASGLLCLLAAGWVVVAAPMPLETSSIGSPGGFAARAGSPFHRAGSVDLAACLQGSREPACFPRSRLQTRAVGAAIDAPGAPTSLTVTVTSNAVTLVWGAPTSGDAVVSYILEAGSAAGTANLAIIVTNSVATTFSASGIGAGTYFVRVRAQNSGGVSQPSNEVVVVVVNVGCVGAPNAPTGLSTIVSGNTVTVSWTAAVAGCAPSSYILEVGSAPGLSNLANFNTGNSATTYVAIGVGPGTYFLRVRAVSGSGASGPSSEVSLTVGPGPGGFVRGTALRFDGNDLVTFGSRAPVGAHTLEMWVKVNSLSASGLHIFAGQTSGPTRACGNGMWLGLAESQLVWLVDPTGACGSVPWISVGFPGIGVWTHVAGSYDGSTSRMYVNGVLAGQLTTAFAPSDWMTAGAATFFNGSQAYFSGEMDELRLWSTARSAAQIQAAMRLSLTGAEAGLIGYWNMNEGSGQLVNDSSPFGIAGQLGTSIQVQSSDPTWVVSTVP